MFDEYAKNLIATIPELPGLSRDECRRALSKAFFYIVQNRFAAGNGTPDSEDLTQTSTLLRKLADALESVAVFDPLNGIQVDAGVMSASAFVAAEALSLLSVLTEQPGPAEISIDPIRVQRNYVAIEAGLLYMIGGYDINAATAVRDVAFSPRGEGSEFDTAAITNGTHLLERILALCRGDLRPAGPIPFTGTDEPPALYGDLVAEIRIRCYEELTGGVEGYLSWLGGNAADLDAATSRIRGVLDATASSNYPGYTAFADVYHLSALLLGTIDSTSRRSTVHSVPPSLQSGLEEFNSHFANYSLGRARGDDEQFGRPFLWPSATEYIKDCLPGPARDAVIAMPTGSGKSFVAELAIAHALSSGSVIYLAPTNALVHQIRRDLQRSLKPFENVRVLAFIGSEEYTTLSEEQVAVIGDRFVAVMTPEKCTLALKLYSLDPVTGQLTPLPEVPPEFTTGRSLSPDGNRSIEVIGKERLVVTDTASAQKREFAFHPYDRRNVYPDSAQWADNRYLVFQSTRTSLIDTDTLKMNYPTDGELGIESVVFSPDFKLALGHKGNGYYLGTVKLPE